MKRIVVGSDGSDRAGEAVGEAIRWAKVYGASLVIVRAYEEEPARDPASAYDPTVRESGPLAGLPADIARPVGVRAEVLRSLDAEVAAAVKAGVEDVTADARPEAPAEALLTVAAETGADLIVVGNKGMTGSARFLLGSVPNKVTHHAPCSVLVVHTA